MAQRPGLAVVDAGRARRDNWGFAVPPDFRLSGFYVEDGVFDPVPIQMRDPQTGRTLRLTVIGVLKDGAPLEMVGISASQETLQRAFPGRFLPTIHYFALAPGVDPEDAAARLESAFLARGMEAESIQKVVDDAVAASMTFNRLIQGFMGLGLIVGVAALGVISARAVAERRQQIGVLRAIGFRRGMVQAVFLLESSFIALTSIVVGTGLGLLLTYEIVLDSRKTPSWENITLVVPWVNLGIIFLVVYLVALAATCALRSERPGSGRLRRSVTSDRARDDPRPASRASRSGRPPLRSRRLRLGRDCGARPRRKRFRAPRPHRRALPNGLELGCDHRHTRRKRRRPARGTARRPGCTCA